VPLDLAPAAGHGSCRGESRNDDHEDADEPYLHIVLLSVFGPLRAVRLIASVGQHAVIALKSR
jgi:hypothetical protein